MATNKIVEMLNQARARELGVIIQYMRQHYEGDGMQSPAILEIFKELAIEEMKHAESFGERIVYLGGTPTTKPDPIRKSDTLKGMIADDLKSEEEAIELYRKAVILCDKEGDPVTRLLFEEILTDEEAHKDTLQTLLGQKGKG
jgi:bacterioferritin